MLRLQEANPEWTIVSKDSVEDEMQELQRADAVAAPSSEMLKRMTTTAGSVKWVHTWSAGVDNVPLKELSENGITVTTSSGVHGVPIAETIFALMLGWTRKIPQYVRQQKDRKWHHANMNAEMYGTTVGLFGTGAIGQETAKRCKAFGMNVLGISRSGRAVEGFDEIFAEQQTNIVLDRCDFVVNSLPLTEATTGFFGKEQFGVMKPNAFFVNVGRGKTVDEDALLHALERGTIAGAGLDVFETEPLPESHPFWTMDQVVMTPHTAGSTLHYDERVCDILNDNMSSLTSKGTLSVNVVDVKLGY